MRFPVLHFFSSFARHVTAGVLDLVYPRSCLLCGKLLEFDKPLYFCRNCLRNLPWIHARCRECGRYLSAAGPVQSACKTCSESRRFFDSGVSALLFDHPAKKLLFHMKYQGDFGLAAPLAGLMTRAYVKNAVSHPDWITFVPLHPFRFKERGFNQSELLANEVGKRLRIRTFPALDRIRFDAVQASLDLRERAKNIRNAFQIKKKFNRKSDHVLLVDDVMTTGNTLNECAKILKENGVSYITVLTLMSVED
ncbi:MAG: ComF family protein [Candidatus Aureabacteria bacterium]|nr:ComF family protein [Candidatus Auribacterota bacterium]